MNVKTSKPQKAAQKERQGVSSRFIEKALLELQSARNGKSKTV